MGEIIRFRSKAELQSEATALADAVAKHNAHVMALIHGVPAQQSTSETDADPRNPNVRKES